MKQNLHIIGSALAACLLTAACGGEPSLFDDDDSTAGVGTTGPGGGSGAFGGAGGSEGGSGGAGTGGQPEGGSGSAGGPLCAPSEAYCDGSLLYGCNELGEVFLEADCGSAPGGACVNARCESSLLALLTFDEGAGSTTTATVPEGLVASMGTVQWDGTLPVGSAAYFVGNHAVEVGDVLNEVSLPFTISAWVRPTTDLSLMTVVATNARPGGNYSGVWLNVDGAAGRTVVVGYGTNQGTSSAHRHGKRSSSAVTPNAWTHIVAIVRAPGDIDILLDGSDAGGTYSGSAAFVASDDAPMLVGRSFWGVASMKGAIDDVRIYDRALTTGEAAALTQLEGSTK